MTPSIFTVFVLSCLVFSFSPGAGAIATMSRTIESGKNLARYNILGLQIALLLHLVIVSAGLGILVASSETIFNIIKYIGSAYLFYLGIMKIRNANSLSLNHGNISTSRRQSIAHGFVVNLTNPKSIVFLVAFLPQFVDKSGELSQYISLGAIIIIIDSLSMLVYSYFSNLLLRYFTDITYLRRLNIIFGGVFIILALMLSLSSLNH